MNVWCSLTYVRINGPFFLWWEYHYKQLIARHVGKLCSYAALQQQPYSSTRWCTCSFYSHFPWVFEGEFLRPMERRRTICMTPSVSWFYACRLFSLGLCERSCVQPKSKYGGWIQSMNHINCKCYSGHGIAHLLYRWDICRAINGTHSEVFHT